jgi:hypothetical protein
MPDRDVCSVAHRIARDTDGGVKFFSRHGANLARPFL